MLIMDYKLQGTFGPEEKEVLTQAKSFFLFDYSKVYNPALPELLPLHWLDMSKKKLESPENQGDTIPHLKF